MHSYPKLYAGRVPHDQWSSLMKSTRHHGTFPTMSLNEIENMSFSVKENGQSFTADMRLRPIIILTSNSEKNLPDAFLRRCVFYHIPFPNPDRLRFDSQAPHGADG